MMDEKEEELKIHNPKGFEPSPGYTASMALSLTQVPIALRYQQCVMTEFISVAPSIIRTWDWPCPCSSSSWIPLCQWHLHLFCKEVRIAHKNGHLGPKHTIDWLSATCSSSKVNVYLGGDQRLKLDKMIKKQTTEITIMKTATTMLKKANTTT